MLSKTTKAYQLQNAVMDPGRLGAWYTSLGAQKRFFNFLFEDFF